jgi:PhzF family phenazine biosynthesis protein
MNLPKDLTLIQVDAFTDTLFTGNPAGVCVTEVPLDDDLMQKIALEMNLSETAFTFHQGDAWRLRWFTPAAEVELCGHATLATAHVLREQGLAVPGTTLTFLTLSGDLRAAIEEDEITLDFPADYTREKEPPVEIVRGLDREILSAGRGTFDWIVELASEEELRTCQPDLPLLNKVECRGIIVTAPGDRDDVVSRFFAPMVGVPEDPVTGSAHCTLATWWSGRMGNRFQARQLSDRGGRMTVELSGERVYLTGRALTVWKITGF